MKDSDSLSVDKGFVIMRAVWFSMVVVAAFYSMLSFMLVRGSASYEPQVVGFLFPVLAAAAVALLALVNFLRSKLKDEKIFPMVAKALAADPAGGVDADRRKAQLLMQNHMTFSVILWSVAETPAIFGLVLTMLSKDMRYVVGFGIYSVAMLVWGRPRRGEFDEQLTRLRRLNP